MLSVNLALPTWMLYLHDWNELLMDRLGKFLGIVKITHFMKPFVRIINYQYRFVLHISKPVSLFNFILHQTNRKIMQLPTWMA